MSKEIAEVVSISLGSATRDSQVETEFLGRRFKLCREGTTGQLKVAQARLRALDGEADVLTIGGADVYLFTPSGKRFMIRDGARLMDCVTRSRVCDGTGLKNCLEPYIIQDLLQNYQEIPIAGQEILFVCGVDRFGMAQSLARVAREIIFGDKIFSLDKDEPVGSLAELELVAEKILPEIIKLPMSMIYPTGTSQDEDQANPEFAKYYHWATVIAGDWHFIKKHLPPRLDGKVIITNTVTAADVALLTERSAAWLITTTPHIDGRSFGTNLIEGVFLVLCDKKWEDMTSDDYQSKIHELDLRPWVRRLN